MLINIIKKGNKLLAVGLVFALVLSMNCYASAADCTDGVMTDGVMIDYFTMHNTRTSNGYYWGSNEIDVYCVGLTAAEETAVEQALAIWSNVSYSIYSIQFNFNMDCSASQAEVTITRTFVPAIPGKEPPLAGVTLTNAYGATNETGFNGGQITHAQIAVNTVYEFTCGAVQSGKYDFKSVILHEMGHVLGIAHCHENTIGDYCTSNCTNNVMRPVLATATVRTILQTYDKASLISVYAIYHPFL